VTRQSVLRFWKNDVLANMNVGLELVAASLPLKFPLTRIADAIRPLPAGGER
jgi:hypothetical protein